MGDVNQLIARAGDLLDRLESILPPPASAPEWDTVAYRWVRRMGRGRLEAVPRPREMRAEDLLGIERQLGLLDANTRQFVHGAPANNALLWGSRGTGKSSLIRALLHRYGGDGLRLVEVDRDDLHDLPDIVALFDGRPERFVLFCDDLSFAADEPGYKALKALLDGSLSAPPENVLLYATSNRRHLLPEFMSENLESKRVDDEIHPGESVEEKISLSDRFGLWVSFHPFDQEQYLAIVRHWLAHYGAPLEPWEALRESALRWALARGSRSGRTALQFARDHAGRAALDGK